MKRLHLPADPRRVIACLLAIAVETLVGPDIRANEANVWPFYVAQQSEAALATESWQALGPLIFERPLPSVLNQGPADTAGGLRPLYVWRKDPAGGLREAYGVYPFLTYRRGIAGSERWSFFNLINYSTTLPNPDEPRSPGAVPFRAFDIWPFYFSKKTGNEALDYQALFPIAGEVKHRFGQDRLSWVLFPLYGRFEKRGVTTTTAPWPFIKVVRGDGNTGFELWPLYGERQKPGSYHERFFLWPFFYRNLNQLEKDQPDEKLGILPFYARDRSEGYLSETWAWPFFGYVDRTQPYRYHARHYFWPLFVQGRGDDRHVNRWAPFYSHSMIKGDDKQWVLWPLWRRLTNREGAVNQTKTQFFYFLYNATEQRSIANPAAAPARKVHVWPLLSLWDNGAGRRQMQMLSPFEVFFPQNEPARVTWSPLFALYRYDHRPDGGVRHSFLWDGITFRREPADGAHEFHLGPLFSDRKTAETRRIALLCGLFGFKREAGRGWRPFFGEFKADTQPTPASPSPSTP